MKNHDPRIAVTEHSLHRGVRPKAREAVRVMEMEPTSPWRHSRSMPDSRDPAAPLPPAPTAATSLFGPSDSPIRFREDPQNEVVRWIPAGRRPASTTRLDATTRSAVTIQKPTPIPLEQGMLRYVGKMAGRGAAIVCPVACMFMTCPLEGAAKV